jgi:hypothetical protein
MRQRRPQAEESSRRLAMRTRPQQAEGVYKLACAMAGPIDLVHHGRFSKCENVVFLHAVGSARLFGYKGIFDSTKPPLAVR